jgi:hypothetical protein
LCCAVIARFLSRFIALINSTPSKAERGPVLIDGNTPAALFSPLFGQPLTHHHQPYKDSEDVEEDDPADWWKG